MNIEIQLCLEEMHPSRIIKKCALILLLAFTNCDLPLQSAFSAYSAHYIWPVGLAKHCERNICTANAANSTPSALSKSFPGAPANNLAGRKWRHHSNFYRLRYVGDLQIYLLATKTRQKRFWLIFPGKMNLFLSFFFKNTAHLYAHRLQKTPSKNIH